MTVSGPARVTAPASGLVSRLNARLRRDHELHLKIDRLERLVERVLENQKRDQKWRAVFRQQLNALVRHTYLADATVPSPHSLQGRRFRLRSQNEEDGIVLALLSAAGVKTRRFVEIGCGRNGGNSAVLAFDFGWGGLMVDANAKAVSRLQQALRWNKAVAVVRAHVEPGSFNDLLRTHGATGEIDLLSIDIDSVDYWLLEALEACAPRVLVMEYNAMFGPDRAVTVPNAPLPAGAPKGYGGASLAALERLARRKGFRLVVCEEAGVNAFFLRDDLAPDIVGLPSAAAFRPARDRYDLDEVRTPETDIYQVIERHRLPLVDV